MRHINGHRFLTASIFTFLAALFIAGCSPADGRLTLSTDQQFQQIVLKKMPGYRLTSAIAGRRVVPSNAYSLEVTNIKVAGKGRDAVFAAFIDGFGKTGLKPVTIYFEEGFGKNNTFWRATFPGCKPRKCRASIRQTGFEKTTRVEHNLYWAQLPKIRFKPREIARVTLGGIKYSARVDVAFDYKGRVIKYSVKSFREAITTNEKAWVKRSPSARRGPTPIPIQRYINNLSLGLAAETNKPNSSGDINSFKGL